MLVGSDRIWSKHAGVINSLAWIDSHTMCSGGDDQMLGIWSCDPMAQVKPLNSSLDIWVQKKTWMGWKDCHWKSNEDEIEIEVTINLEKFHVNLFILISVF